MTETVEPEWIEKAIDWYAAPDSEREPKTVTEFYESMGVARATFYYHTSKPDFDSRVIRKALSSAKKYTSNVLEALRQKAMGGNVLAQMTFLKFVAELAERFKHEEKTTIENRTIIELVEKTSKKLEKDGVNIEQLLEGITVRTQGDSNTPETPE
jgi:hypothetical protein